MAVSEDEGSGRYNCPTCRAESEARMIEAEQLVMSAVKAIIEHDEEMMSLTQTQLGALEAHLASSMLAGQIVILSEIFGVDPLKFIVKHQADLNEQAAHQA